jgi:hypothetical protein
MAEMAIMVAYPEQYRKDLEKELGMGIVVESGDTKLIWNIENDTEVGVAEAAFKKLTKKGFTAFSVKKNGDPGSKITEFDPSLEKMILIPQMQGG